LPSGLTFGLLVGWNVHKDDLTNTGLPAVPVRLRRSWRGKAFPRIRGRRHRQQVILAAKAGLLAGIVNVPLNAILVALGLVKPSLTLVGEIGLIVIWSAYPGLIFASAVWVALEVSGLVEEPVRLSEVWSPVALVRSDRRTALFEAMVGGFAAAVLSGFVAALGGWLILVVNNFSTGPRRTTSIGSLLEVVWESGFADIFVLAILVMVFLMTAWGRFALTRLYLGCTGQLPIRLMRLLATARDKGILRQTGPAYQFRHLKLQDRLASGQKR
jgi:hypothetical protein